MHYQQKQVNPVSSVGITGIITETVTVTVTATATATSMMKMEMEMEKQMDQNAAQ